MKKFQSIIQKYITNHQKHKKYLAAVLALSILVSFGVSAGLIMPAVSMTEDDNKVEQHIHSEECYQISCGNESKEHIHSDECYVLACSESGNYLQLLSNEGNEENQEEHEVPIVDSDLGATADVIDEEMDWNSYAMYFDSIAILDNESGPDENGIIHVSYDENNLSNAGIVILEPKATVLSKTEGGSWDSPKDIYSVQFNMKYSISQEFVDQYFKGDSPEADSFSFDMGFNQDWITNKLYNKNGIVYNGSEEAGTFTIDGNGRVVITFNKTFIAGSGIYGVSGTFNFKAELWKDQGNESDEDIKIGGVEVEIPIYTYNHKPDIGVEKSVSKDYNISTYKAEYKVVVSTINGTNGKVTITDTLSSNDDMTFDFANGATVSVIKQPDGNIISTTVSVNGNKAIISNLPELDAGESYEWLCPVIVKDDKLEAVKNDSTKISISSKNTVTVSDGKLTANAEANINQTIKANIAKNGEYDAANENDRIRWTVTISNPGGINLGGYKVSDSLSADIVSWEISPDGKGSFDDKRTYTFGDGADESSYTITYYTDASHEHGNNVKNTANLENPNGDKIKAEKTVPVPKQQTVNKTGGNFNGSEVEWTITINNPYGRDLNGFTIVDEAFKELTDNPLSAYGTLSGNTFTFNKTIKANPVTLKYKIPITDNDRNKDISNTAILKENDITIDTGTTIFHVPERNQGLSKNGDFRVNESDGTGYIRWVVHVTNPYGASLNGYYVTDAKFNDTVKLYSNADGTNAISGGTLSDDDSTATKRYTFPNGLNGTDYYIIYDEPVAFTNEVQWITNTAGDSAGNGTERGVNVPENLQEIDSKTATFDAEKNIVTWQITINNTYSIPIEKWIGDKTVTDEMMSKALSFNVYGYNDNVNDKTVIPTTKPTGNSFVFTNDMGTYKKYVIEYTTAKNSEQHSEKNKATFNNVSKERTVNTSPREELTKNYLNGAEVTGDTIDIPWEVSLRYSQGVFGGKTYKDTMKGMFIRNGKVVSVKEKQKDENGNLVLDDNGKSTEIDEVITLNHYITQDQLNVLEIWGKEPDGNLVKLNDAIGKYTATRGADGKSFEILFGTSDADKEYWNKYSELKLVYKTTGEGMNNMNNNSVPLGDQFTFRNNSDFNGNETSKDYGITKKSAIQKYDVLANSTANNTTHMLTEFTNSIVTLQWKLVVNESKNYADNDDIILTDYIPKDLIVDADNFITSFKVNGQEQTGYTIEVQAQDKDGKTPVTITIPHDVHNGKKVEIEYKVTISKSKLKKDYGTAGASFENEVRDDKGNSVKQTQKVVDKLEDFSKSLVSPVFDFKTENNISTRTSDQVVKVDDKKFTYVLDLNPYKKDLDKNSNTITITDIFNDTTTYGNQPLDITLLDKKVYQVNDDGSIRELNNNEYKYDYDIKKCSEPVMGDPAEALSSVHTIKLTVPDEMHIRVEYTYLLDQLEKSTYLNVNVGNRARLSFETKEYRVECAHIEFERSDASATAVVQPYIQIEKVEEGHYDVKLAGAVFELERWHNGTWEPMIGIDKEAVTVTDDVTDEVKKYDKAKWGVQGSKAFQFSTNTSGLYSLPLLGEDGSNGDTIYRLTEISAPSGYYLDPNSTVYYFSGTLTEDFEYPPRVSKNDLEKISNQKIRITNTPRSIDVEKIWKNVTDDDATPPVKVQLYRTTASLIDSNDKAHITINVNFNRGSESESESKTYRFDVEKGSIPMFTLSGICFGVTSESENGKDLGEISERTTDSNSTNALPIFNFEFKNPINEDVTYNIVLDAYTSYPYSIEESMYNISVGGKSINGDECEKVLPEGTTGEPVYKDDKVWTVTLNDDNNWRYSFTDNTVDHSLLPETDKGGKVYHYFVKEVPVPDGFVVSYVGNGTENGSIQVINTYNPQNLKVVKTWVNKGHDDKQPDGIYVQLYKSTNKSATEFTDADKVGNRRYIIPKEDGTWEAEWTEDNLRTLLTNQGYDKSQDSDQNPLTDNNGNPYYFFVKEETVDDYYPTYTNNGIKKGTVGITNTYINFVKPPIKLEKNWLGSNVSTALTDTSDIKSVQVEIWKTSKAPATSNPDDGKSIDLGNNTYSTEDSDNIISFDTNKNVKRLIIQVIECHSEGVPIAFGCDSWGNNGNSSNVKFADDGKLINAWYQDFPNNWDVKDDMIIIDAKNLEIADHYVLLCSSDKYSKVKFRIEYTDGSYMGSETYDAATNTFGTIGGSTTVVTPSADPIPEGAERVGTATITVQDDGTWYTLLDELPAYETDGSEIFYYFRESKVISTDGKDITSKYIVSYNNNNGIGGVKESAKPEEQQIVSISNSSKPVGTIKVDKQWVGNEAPDSGTIEFFVYSSTEWIKQPENPEGFGENPAPPEGGDTETPEDDGYVSFKNVSGDREIPLENITKVKIDLKTSVKDYNEAFYVGFDSSGVNLNINSSGEFSGSPWYWADSSGLNIVNNSFEFIYQYGTFNNVNLGNKNAANDISVKCVATTSDDKNYELKWNADKTQLLFEEVQEDEPTTEPPTEPDPTPVEPSKEYERIKDPIIGDAKKVGTIKVTKQPDGTWSGTLGNLPLKDASDTNLYYYVVEQNSDSGDYIPVAYVGNATTLTENTEKTIIVHNQKQESDGVKMPSTGGTGTTWYYITGMAFMLIPVVILARRRKKST